MAEARRKAVRVMRKVKKETEKMCGRLVGQSVAGGVEAVWEQWIQEGRMSITAAGAAEYLLNANTDAKGKDKARVTVKKNTLPAYAAHTLLMERPDLFVSDTGDMWKSGLFLLRSREGRDRLKRVEGWFDGTLPGSKEIVERFTIKARAAVDFSKTLTRTGEIEEARQDLPEWSPEERDIISVLTARLYEVRSTQTPPTTALSYLIMKVINAYPGEQIDQPLVKRFLTDIGALSRHDSLEQARATESNRRTLALHSLSGRVLGAEDLLTGTELDDLREDYTGHTVFVIDDASASELDDGISVEKAAGGDYWVHVHVADPTRYLRPDHPTAIRASVQGSSLYTPEGNIPLIPLGITMKELSLGGTDDKQGVVTFSALVGNDGSIKDEKVKMGWIRSPRVITYSSVNEALGLGSKAPPTRPFGTPIDLNTSKTTKPVPAPTELEDLRVLHDFAINHRRRRYANSGLEWSLEAGNIRLLSKLPSMSSDAYNPSSLPRQPLYSSGEPVIDYSVASGGSTSITAQAMVAECMILAGKIGASFCHRHSVPAPFRGSSAPQIVGLNSGMSATTVDDILAERNEGGAIDPFRMKKYDIYLPPGTINTTVTPHWIMGLTQPDVGYLRATSPLRRYDDLLVHWQIKAHLASQKGVKAPWSMMGAEEVLSLGQRSDTATKRNKRAGGNAEAWWLARLIRSRLLESPDDRYSSTEDMVDLHDPIEARISGPPILQRDGTAYSQIWIPGLGTSAQMAVPKSTVLPIGETVRTRVGSADLDPVPIIFSSWVE